MPLLYYSTDLVHCTNEPNVSIPHLANLLVERSQNANWVVVYKALLTVHHLLAYGNEVCYIVLVYIVLRTDRLMQSTSADAYAREHNVAYAVLRRT